MVTCSKCKETKPLSSFYMRKTGTKGYYSECKDCASLRFKNRRLNNLELYRDRNRVWRTSHKDRLKASEQRRYKKNPGVWHAKAAKRRAAKLNQTLAWANLKEIESFYKECPKGYHVDHIIPLQGKTVRGLHVIHNLQYLPASVNCSKGNKV